MAQSVEQLIRNQQVIGSNPITSSKISNLHCKLEIFLSLNLFEKRNGWSD